MKRIRQGDVYAIPIDERRYALSQVVGVWAKKCYYFAVFDIVCYYPIQKSNPLAISDLSIKFITLSFDAKIYHGDWEMVGSFPVRSDIPFPAYKEEVSLQQKTYIVDYTGTRSRLATTGEASLLEDRIIVAPVSIEKALRASLGMQEWDSDYDELLPENIMLTSNEAFGPL
jgi:hypothetical protein